MQRMYSRIFSFTNMVFKKKNLFWSFAKTESLSSDLYNTCKFKLPDHINFNGHTSIQVGKYLETAGHLFLKPSSFSAYEFKDNKCTCIHVHISSQLFWQVCALGFDFGSV